MRTILASVLILALPGAASAASASAVAADASAQGAFRDAASALEVGVGGKIGFSARHLESGLHVAVNENDRFPMASIMKVAVAAAVLKRVDKGEVELDRMLVVEPRILEESGPVADSVIHPGTAMSVANLLELMLTKSNNAATDMMVELAGGPAAVTRWLKSVGIDGQRIDNDTQDLLKKFYGLPKDKPMFISFLGEVQRNPAFMDRMSQPNPAFDADPADTSTPEAMTTLLRKLFAGELVSAAGTDFLKGVMQRCVTGEKRLKGMLPAGVTVAHKTGTLGGSINDAGVITLPGNRGHVAISVFVKESAKPVEARERAIAEITRTIYDYFLTR